MAFPDPVTSDLRPKTKVSVYAFGSKRFLNHVSLHALWAFSG